MATVTLKSGNECCSFHKLFQQQGYRHIVAVKWEQRNGNSPFGYGHFSKNPRVREVDITLDVCHNLLVMRNPSICDSLRRAFVKPRVTVEGTRQIDL
jgi:hypothetical protein